MSEFQMRMFCRNGWKTAVRIVQAEIDFAAQGFGRERSAVEMLQRIMRYLYFTKVKLY